MDKRQAITKPIIQAAIIMAVFYAIETAMVYLKVFPDNNTLMCADIMLRIIFGIVALMLLKNWSKRGESKYTVKQLFTNRISCSLTSAGTFSTASLSTIRVRSGRDCLRYSSRVLSSVWATDSTFYSAKTL